MFFNGSDEVALSGHNVHAATLRVHRFWEDGGVGGKPAIPASDWESHGFVVHDYDNASASLIVARHSLEVLDLYNRLPNWSARSDLFRYVVLYEHGGWWADTDVKPTPRMAELAARHNLVFFHEACGRRALNRLKKKLGLTSISRTTQLKTAIFATKRAWKPLLGVIDLVQRRAWDHHGIYSEEDVVDITGPGALTDAVLDALVDDGASLVTCAESKSYFEHLGLGLWRGKAVNELGTVHVG